MALLSIGTCWTAIDVGVSECDVLGVCGLVWYANGTWSCFFQLVKDEKLTLISTQLPTQSRLLITSRDFISTLTPTTVGWNVSSIGVSILG